MRLPAIIALAALALLPAACSNPVYDQAKAAGMTDQQYWACEDFLNGVDKTSPVDRPAKQALATKVNEWAQRAEGALALAGNGLASAAPLTPSDWYHASDQFSRACIAAGWPTDDKKA